MFYCLPAMKKSCLKGNYSV